MKFVDFSAIISPERMQRYLNSCGGDTRKAMTLYRANLHLSQEMFTLISCFEIALRNAINKKLSSSLGNDWLRDSVLPGGIFTTRQFNDTYRIINKAYLKQDRAGVYTHTNLLSNMEFGIWKYMFSNLSIE